MHDAIELHQVIYGLLSAQIEFGSYHYKDPLPTIEEASRFFAVSPDTVRVAYLQLKRKGYITLTKKAGAFVAVQFEEPELEMNIQTFFSLRKDAVLDLCQSLGPLFRQAQWFAFKNAGPEQLDELERLCAHPLTLEPYIMVQHIRLIYGTLNNDLLLRLVWQGFLFYQAPFLSLPENLAAFEDGNAPLLNMIGLCRRKDWDGLWRAVTAYQEQLSCAIERFYDIRITVEPSGEPVPFQWSAYQKSTQRCYSLAIELLKDIRRGLYAQGSFLPSPAKIADKKQVSVSTVRRTLALLNQLGATRSINGVGTQVLRAEDSAVNFNFSQPAIRRRLLDFVQSLQILSLTCRDCAKSVFAAASPAADRWKETLSAIKKSRRYEAVVFSSLEIIARYSPTRAILVIYRQLLHVLIWGYPLRSLHGSREEINEYYLPRINSMVQSLESRDWDGLAGLLEKIMCEELEFAAARLGELGISEAAGLIIPQR